LPGREGRRGRGEREDGRKGRRRESVEEGRIKEEGKQEGG